MANTTRRDLVEKMTKVNKKIEDTEDENIAEIQVDNSKNAILLKKLFLGLLLVNVATLAGVVFVGLNMYSTTTKLDKEETLDKKFVGQMAEQRRVMESRNTSIIQLRNGTIVANVINVTAYNTTNVVLLYNTQKAALDLRARIAVEKKKLVDYTWSDYSAKIQAHYPKYQALFKFKGCHFKDCSTLKATAKNSTGFQDCMNVCYENGNRTMKGFTFETATKLCSCDAKGDTGVNLAAGYIYYIFS